MLVYLREKIERARQEPEHIRKRYVYICLAVSMVFVFGIWILSLQDGYRTISREVPATIERSKEGILPSGKTPSLNELLEDSTPLRIQGETETGDNFFEKQFEERSAVPTE